MFSCGSQGQLGNLGQMLKYKVRGVSAQLPTRPRCRNPSSGVTTNSTWRRRPTPAPWKSFHLTFPTFRMYVPQLCERNKQANTCKGCVLCILERESAGSHWKVAFLRLPALPDGHQELWARVTDVRRRFTQLLTLATLDSGPPGTDRPGTTAWPPITSFLRSSRPCHSFLLCFPSLLLSPTFSFASILNSNLPWKLMCGMITFCLPHFGPTLAPFKDLSKQFNQVVSYLKIHKKQGCHVWQSMIIVNKSPRFNIMHDSTGMYGEKLKTRLMCFSTLVWRICHWRTLSCCTSFSRPIQHVVGV